MLRRVAQNLCSSQLLHLQQFHSLWVGTRTASCSTSTPTSHCAMHISSPSLSDCCQSGQIQTVSIAHPDPMPVASDACQTQPLMNHCVSQQLYPSNQQYSLQRVCEPSSRCIGHNMPVISNVTDPVLARAVTMPNLWSLRDSSPHSLNGTRQVHSERDLMAIAMPDAFSLSKAEIVSQLKSAAPFTYEDWGASIATAQLRDGDNISAQLFLMRSAYLQESLFDM